MKVVKFGGTSLASGEQIEKVFNIVLSDAERKIVVVSAPGKRHPADQKVTDLLIDCAEAVLAGKDAGQYVNNIIERYESIAAELKLSNEIVTIIRQNIISLLTKDTTNPEQFTEALKASGEDNQARLVAAYFKSMGVNANYVNPQDAGLIVSNEPGNAQVLAESYDKLYSLRNREGIIIFPGFFGYSEEGEVVTFSRSGSDVTGSILANGINASLYENYTDVDAVFSANPHIVPNPREIRELTYREMRELSYAGFSVLHDEALIPAYRAGIPVNIKNTNNPAAPGTLIVNQRENTNGPVIGIASDKNFCSIYVSKYLMNREIGFGRKLLQILEDFGLSYEHIPSGIDDLTIVLRQNQMSQVVERSVLERIRIELEADEVDIVHNLSLIMIVGEGMRHNVGTTARASKALAEVGVNIEMLNQGSSEVSVMFGVKETQENDAVHALYNEFFAKVLV